MATSPDPGELRARLSPEQFRITQLAGTEAPFTGPWLHEHRSGTYRCVVCGHELFASDTKFDSGSGWPSFTDPLAPGSVADHPDHSHGMVRTETRCANCGAHLGHVFPDGPGASGLRYCINGAALDLDVDPDA